MTNDRDKHPQTSGPSGDCQPPELPANTSADEPVGGNSRRRFVKAGLTAVPIIFTLRSRPAWGQGPVAIGTTPTAYAAPGAGDGGDAGDFGSLGEESDQDGFFQDPWADDESDGENGDDW